MKWKTVALAMVIVGLAADAFAATITYSTLGRFNGGAFSASPTLTAGGASLTFNGLGSTSVDPGNLGYGTFDSNAVGSGGTIPAGTTFDLQIVQTTPTGGTASAAATLSGTLTTTASAVRVLFSSSTFNIGTVSYAIDQPINGIAIVSPASNSGMSTIQGSAIVIPEPSLVVCFAIGLITLGMTTRKRA